MRGAQHREVCLSQPLTPKVKASFTRSGATAWRWRDARMREELELSLNTELEADSFKKDLDDSPGRKSDRNDLCLVL